MSFVLIPVGGTLMPIQTGNSASELIFERNGVQVSLEIDSDDERIVEDIRQELLGLKWTEPPEEPDSPLGNGCAGSFLGAIVAGFITVMGFVLSDVFFGHPWDINDILKWSAIAAVGAGIALGIIGYATTEEESDA